MRDHSGSLTDLPMSPDEDRQRRFRMYFYMMLVRVACLGIFFIVPGWWKLIPAFFAVFIPYFAVVIANVSTRHTTEGLVSPNALPPGASAHGPGGHDQHAEHQGTADPGGAEQRPGQSAARKPPPPPERDIL